MGRPGGYANPTEALITAGGASGIGESRSSSVTFLYRERPIDRCAFVEAS